jgi:hypothetical protein
MHPYDLWVLGRSSCRAGVSLARVYRERCVLSTPKPAPRAVSPCTILHLQRWHQRHLGHGQLASAGQAAEEDGQSLAMVGRIAGLERVAICRKVK